MALIVESVPAIAGEVEIPSKSGCKRKSGCSSSSTTRRLKKARTSETLAESNKENKPSGAIQRRDTREADGKKPKSSSSRSLKKAEKRVVADAILNVDKFDLTAAVLEQVDKELHIRSFEDRLKFWETMKVSNMVMTLCESLKALYESIYTKCSKGKEKHARFQFEWYQQCGYMLVEEVAAFPADKVDGSISSVIPKWIEFRRNQLHACHMYHANAVLIAVQGATFNHLAHTAAEHMSSVAAENDTQSSSQQPASEPDEVYYKFGGAAIAEMLKKRYRSIHSCPQVKRGIIVTEISVLKAMQCSNKNNIPPSLQYRDNGFMYFPDEDLIPFIKAVDDKVKRFANNKGVQEHAGNIVQVTTDNVKADMSLKRKFEEFLRKKFDSLDEMSNAMDSVYAEFLRKLCNTRLGEFLDSYKQIQLSKSGSASLSGQNLRDTLLSQHINLKTQIA